MIRIWGGGYYETEAFYDLCDRLGILVWQDFMFACSVYPLTDPEFLANLEVEVREQVRRLRHRACLALWCGNNEMERGWTNWGWSRPGNEDLRAAYLRFFSETLPAWVAAQDPATPYWPSSPSSGRPLAEPIGGNRGDEHEWIVWHALAPFSAYGHETYRFVSEFGFESLPALATVAAFAPDPADWNLGSPLLDHHQRCPVGNARILYYMAQQFRLPKDFPSLVYLSQVLHAEAMRVGVEHWRRAARPLQRGAVLAARRLLAGVLVGEHRLLRPLEGPAVRHAAVLRAGAALRRGGGGRRSRWPSPTTGPRPGGARSAGRWSGSTARSCWPAAARSEARALATTPSGRVPLPDSAAERRSLVLVSELLEAGSRRALVVTTFVPDKQLALAGRRWRPRSRQRSRRRWARPSRVAGAAGRATVRLRSDTLARWVELSLDGADVVFDDNYFDLPAGRDVTVSFELPEGWDLARARAALRVRSVVDTYA